MSKANEIQVGGEHYKAHGTATMQHWDLVAKFSLDYFQGNITKYLFRWRNKNGLQDLQKSEHYLNKYIELVTAGLIRDDTERMPWTDTTLTEALSTFKLDYFQDVITRFIMGWYDIDGGLLRLTAAHAVLHAYIHANSDVTGVALSPELTQVVRDDEWDKSRSSGSSQPSATACMLCGGFNGIHLVTCDRAVKPALLYRGPDVPLEAVDPTTLKPLPVPHGAGAGAASGRGGPDAA